MRITTNQILRNYKSNLGNSLSNLDSARTKVMTGRKFNSTAEDPGSALRASVLERKYVRNDDYLSLVKDVQSFQDSQEDAAMQINSLAQHLSKQYGLEALNGTNGSLSTRETYAAAWRGAQESMVLSLNASYEGKYVFAGSDGQSAPFKLLNNVNTKVVVNPGETPAAGYTASTDKDGNALYSVTNPNEYYVNTPNPDGSPNYQPLYVRAEDNSGKTITDTEGNPLYTRAFEIDNTTSVYKKEGNAYTEVTDHSTIPAPSTVYEAAADTTQVLLYRNVDVTTGNLYDGNGKLIDADPTKSAERLKKLSSDSLYVDLGFGMTREKEDKIDNSNAFNTSLPGINLVGFDKFPANKDGIEDPQNMVLLMGKIAHELGKEDGEFDYERYRELLEKFDGDYRDPETGKRPLDPETGKEIINGREKVLEVITTLGTNTEFLTTTKDRLETNEISLATQIDNVVNIDMAEAIMNFSWAQYAYNASLKVGNQILTPSFIDFMS